MPFSERIQNSDRQGWGLAVLGFWSVEVYLSSPGRQRAPPGALRPTSDDGKIPKPLAHDIPTSAIRSREPIRRQLRDWGVSLRPIFYYYFGNAIFQVSDEGVGTIPVDVGWHFCGRVLLNTLPQGEGQPVYEGLNVAVW